MDYIYDSYHLSQTSSDYTCFLLNVTIGDVCSIINDTVSSISDSSSFMNVFKFSSN